MNKRYLLAALFALAITAGVFAQALTISYLDGVVELKTAKGWQALSIGDKVAADASVRITQGGSLELLKGTVRITLIKDGTYDLAALSKAAGKPAAGGIGTTIAQKLSTLTTEKPKASAAGGVRGAAQGTSDGSIMWVDESDETRSQVQALMDKKKYADAVKLLHQAIADSSSDAEKEELGYLIGAAYYGAGQEAQAYRALANITPGPDAEYYARYVILKAQVLVDSSAWKEALDLLNPFIAAYPTGEATQVAYLLSYYCQNGVGDQAAAKAALDAGYTVNPTTDTAKLIDQQRKAQ
jgi:tetratricopeptide (TPR) repeat protein